MRVFVLNYEFPPLGGGGGQAAEDICRGLAARGHEVRVLTAHLGDLPRDEQRGGLRILRIPSGRRLPYKAGLLAMGGYILAGLWHGLRLVRRWKPDVMHAHFAVPTGALAWGLSRLTGVPYVLTAHLGDVPGGVPDKTDRWFRWVYPFTPPIWRAAARVTAVSEFTRRLAHEYYPVDILVVHNGVDTRQLDPGEMRVGDPPLVVFAGRFMPQKNPLLIVRALAQLQDLDWNCAMLGDGPLHAEVQAEIARHGLEQRFTLPGWINPEQVIEWFGRSDILFMPSFSEGLPLVGVQSLSMGLAMVTSDIGGFIDLVEPGVNGYRVPAGDLDGFILKLRELLSDRERLQAFRQASRRRAKVFDLEKIVGQYEKMLQEVIETD